MVYEHHISGLTLQTGDLICTTDGEGGDIVGLFWRLIGKFIPGDVDHIAIYVGPGGRSVEAGAKGKVITFDITGDTWDARSMMDQRGMFVDTLHGVAYPLEGKGLSRSSQDLIREEVARYCLEQAVLEKPYNINFLNSSTERAFYCSQLAYKAYFRQGIDLNTGVGVGRIPGTKSVILPQEIWDGSVHSRAVHLDSGGQKEVT